MTILLLLHNPGCNCACVCTCASDTGVPACERSPFGSPSVEEDLSAVLKIAFGLSGAFNLNSALEAFASKVRPALDDGIDMRPPLTGGTANWKPGLRGGAESTLAGMYPAGDGMANWNPAVGIPMGGAERHPGDDRKGYPWAPGGEVRNPGARGGMVRGPACFMLIAPLADEARAISGDTLDDWDDDDDAEAAEGGEREGGDCLRWPCDLCSPWEGDMGGGAMEVLCV